MKKLRIIPITLGVAFAISQGYAADVTNSNFVAAAQAVIAVPGITIDTTGMPECMAQDTSRAEYEVKEAAGALKILAAACDGRTNINVPLKTYSERLESVRDSLAMLFSSLDYIEVDYPFHDLIYAAISELNGFKTEGTAIVLFRKGSAIIQDIGNAIKAITDQNGKASIPTEAEMQPLLKLGVDEEDVLRMFDTVRAATSGTEKESYSGSPAAEAIVAAPPADPAAAELQRRFRELDHVIDQASVPPHEINVADLQSIISIAEDARRARVGLSAIKTTSGKSLKDVKLKIASGQWTISYENPAKETINDEAKEREKEPTPAGIIIEASAQTLQILQKIAQDVESRRGLSPEEMVEAIKYLGELKESMEHSLEVARR